MAHEDLSESFKSSTETLSNQVRYVNYGLIAVVWILSGNAFSGLTTDGNGIILALIISSLFLDLCQYIWNTVTIFCYHQFSQKDKKGSKRIRGQKPSTLVFNEYEVPAKEEASTEESSLEEDPKYITYGGAAFFLAKILCCLAACVMLVARLF